MSINDEIKCLDCHGTTLLHTSDQCFYLFVNSRRNVLRLKELKQRNTGTRGHGSSVLNVAFITVGIINFWGSVQIAGGIRSLVHLCEFMKCITLDFDK